MRPVIQGFCASSHSELTLRQLFSRTPANAHTLFWNELTEYLSRRAQGAVNVLNCKAECEGALGDRRIAGPELAAVLRAGSKVFESLGMNFILSMIRCSKTVILAPGSSW